MREKSCSRRSNSICARRDQFNEEEDLNLAEMILGADRIPSLRIEAILYVLVVEVKMYL